MLDIQHILRFNHTAYHNSQYDSSLNVAIFRFQPTKVLKQ